MLAQGLLDAARADPATSPPIAAGPVRLDRAVAPRVERVTVSPDISRPAAGPADPAPAHSSAAVREAAEALEPVAARHGVGLRPDVRDGVVGPWDEWGCATSPRTRRATR